MYARVGEVSTSWDAASGKAALAAAPAVVAAAAVLPSATAATLARVRAPSQPPRQLPTIRINGVTLHAVTEQQCIDHILDELDEGRGGVVVTPNLDHMYRCLGDLYFSALLAEAQLVVADGMPLVWASRLQGTPLPERVAGSNLISSLSRGASLRGKSIFLLGGAPGTAEAAAGVLRQRHPDVKIAGVHCPPLGFEHNPRLIAEMERALCEAKPDIIFVALGSPKQERLIGRLRKLLPGAWWLGVGASFSFLAGQVRRAPAWMQKTGLEWLHRLSQEPTRLFKRYVMTGIPFAGLMLAKATMHGVLYRAGLYKLNAALGTASPPPKDRVLSPTFVRDETAAIAAAADRMTRRRAAESQDPIESTAVAAGTARSASLARLRGFVLLGGAVRPTQIGASIGRSVLDLPLDAGTTILNHWLSNAVQVGELAGLDRLPVRLLVDRNSPEPVSAAVRYFGSFRVERDLSEYRGTGGVLRDLAKDYDDEDLILIANGAQVLMDPLAAITAALDRKKADITLISHRDGTPSGVMLVKCKTLRLIPASGFVDMKEQALPLIASQFDVKVVHCRRPTGLPVWSLSDYVSALRYHHRKDVGRPAPSDPLAEDWRPSFSIVEEGAVVDSSARIHDAVVLRGGTVEANAVVVRSVVCAGGIVRHDRAVVDEYCRRC